MRSTRSCSSFPNDCGLKSWGCSSRSGTLSGRFSISILSCSAESLICRFLLRGGPVLASLCSLSWVALTCVLMRILSLSECTFLGGRLHRRSRNLPLARCPSSSEASCLALLFWAAPHSAHHCRPQCPVNWPWSNSFSIIAWHLACWKGSPATSAL